MSPCKNCQKDFVISEKDKTFLAKFGVSTLNLCHLCRWQQKMCFQNEYCLYNRSCDATGKPIVSVYRPDAPFSVYARDYWYSDKWVRPSLIYNPVRPFFEQYQELSKLVPRPANTVTNSVNCDFCQNIYHSSDSYLSCQAYLCEKLFYCYRSFKLKESIDCFFCSQSELLYDCANCHNSYNLKSCDDCKDCRDSALLIDCRDCHDCLMCWNLRHKQFCIFNQQYTEESYQQKIKELKLTRTDWGKYQSQIIYRSVNQINCENSVGDYLVNCADCFETYFSDDSKDCQYVFRGTLMKDSFDTLGGGEGELNWQTVQPAWYYNCRWCLNGDHLRDSDYCDWCMNCHDCLGCIGLQRGEFCILNKQYSEEEYKKLRAKILAEVQDFFPVAFSPFAYNETIANLYFPLTRETAMTSGYTWLEAEDKNVDPSLPICQQCQGNFKIIPQEAEYYQKNNLPMPQFCFKCRLLNRARPFSSTHLWEATCANCGDKIKSGRNPNLPGRIYCVECYQKEIY